MNIAVVGTGYEGLVTGTCLAETGNNVTCVDIDKKKVEQLRNGEIPIYEPHLDNLFQRNIKQERLFFTTNLNEAVEEAKLIFLALPTPPGEDGSADLSYVHCIYCLFKVFFNIIYDIIELKFTHFCMHRQRHYS